MFTQQTPRRSVCRAHTAAGARRGRLQRPTAECADGCTDASVPERSSPGERRKCSRMCERASRGVSAFVPNLHEMGRSKGEAPRAAIGAALPARCGLVFPVLFFSIFSQTQKKKNPLTIAPSPHTPPQPPALSPPRRQSKMMNDVFGLRARRPRRPASASTSPGRPWPPPEMSEGREGMGYGREGRGEARVGGGGGIA